MTSFYRVSGGGNDFLALIEPERDPAAGEIAAWCRRGLSLGADGLFTLRRAAAGAVRMDYWNADGRPADLCINGTRCAARLAFVLGWAQREVSVLTGAGPVRALAASAPGESAVGLVTSPAPAPEPRAVAVDGVAYAGFVVRVGVPHFVVFWPESLARAPVAGLGARLRRHPEFAPQGTNVDFVRVAAPQELEVRSFERGVEAETLACGTGVLAAAAAALHLGEVRLPLTALTAGGFRLRVEADPGGGWRLHGDARLLARGEILPEAATLPPPPRWSDTIAAT